MRRSWLVPLSLVLLACGDASDPSTRDAGQAEPAAQLTAKIELSATTVQAGGSIDARLIVQNDTGEAIEADGCGSLFNVALASDDLEPLIAWTDCLQPLTVPEGRSVYDFEVLASYLGCAEDAAPGQPFPRCVDGEVPALPPGTYEARLFQSTPVIPDAPAVEVVVTP